MSYDHVVWRNHQPRRRRIRAFMQEHYTDENVAALLAHMRDGKFSFYSCCCFIGIPTANHALRSECSHLGIRHYDVAKKLHGADLAEIALAEVGNVTANYDERDRIINRFLLPMVRAEIRRRDRERAAIVEEQSVGSVA